MNKVLMGLSVLAAANMAFAATSETTATKDAGETSAKIETVKEVDKKWSVTLLQETYVMANAAHRRNFTGEVAADSYIGLGYALSDTKSVQFRQNFMMNQTDASKDSEYVIYDPALIYKDKEAFKVNNTPIVNEYRLYLPVSDYSKDVGKVEGRYTAAFDQVLSKDVTLTYSNNLRGYYYSENNDGQRSIRNFTDVTATLNNDSIFEPYFTVGYQVRWYHTGAGLNNNGTEYVVSNPGNNYDKPYWILGTNIDAGPIGITVYAEQDHNLRKAGNDFKFANEDEMFYSMVLSASL